MPIGDWAGARQQYEQALQVRPPKDVNFYEHLAQCCLKEKATTQGLTYIQQGLALEGRSLRLLTWHVEARAGMDQAGGELAPALAKELLAITDKMQAVNPEYPYAYFLRGGAVAKVGAIGYCWAKKEVI